MPKICSNCGSIAKDDLNFCENCGVAFVANNNQQQIINEAKSRAGKKSNLKKYIIFLIILIVVSVAGFGFLYSQSTLSVQSDPSGAGVYLDSVYKGSTPCLISGVSLGEHVIELRHDRFPVWNKNITLVLGKTENITADLSDNLIPTITILCKSQLTSNEPSKDIQNNNGWASYCIYSINEAIYVSGVAVRPYLKENPNLKLSLKRTDSYYTNSNLDYSVPIHDDFTFNYIIPNSNLPSGNYQIVASIPSGQTSNVDISIESPVDTKVKILKQIVEAYHKTHTYSLPDLYVCGDMSSDIWDMLKTQGINAKIVVGNVDKDITSIDDANHVWVLAETSPEIWIALETTGGYLVCPDKNICSVNNPRYYHGWGFNTPKEFKDALDKMKHPCSEGYILGDDNLCHQACGGNRYCTGDSVCVNGRCIGCAPGYYLGTDLRCYKS